MTSSSGEKGEKVARFAQVVASLAVAALIVAVVVGLVLARLPLDRLPHEQDREDRWEDSDNSGRGSKNGERDDD